MFDPKKFKNKKACVLGGGKTGLAAAELLKKKKFKVFLSDENAFACAPKGVEAELGGHTDKVLGCGFIVKSPGISPAAPILKKAVKKKIPVFSEIEVALAFIPKQRKVFAVTGTNGKTTATMMTAAIMKEFCRAEKKGRKTFMAGNVGTPLSAVADKVKAGDILVLEMSSYQLEDSSYFKPDAACVLNITPDHISHHGSFKKYTDAKKRIFMFQSAKDTAVINASDKKCVGMAKSARAKVLSFSTTPDKEIRSQVFFDGDEMVFSSGMRLRPPRLRGLHNVENAMAAALMAAGQGVKPAEIQRAFNKFKNVEHRIEDALTYKGIVCINDSKSTNIESTITALKALGEGQNVWLILGGRGKGMSYKTLRPYLDKYCKRVLAIGEDMVLIIKELSDIFPVKECKTIDKAVAYTFKNLKGGGVLLLSPACASFDQFKNFEERGKYFKKVCKALSKK